MEGEVGTVDKDRLFVLVLVDVPEGLDLVTVQVLVLRFSLVVYSIHF